jgi:hypothetical protein
MVMVFDATFNYIVAVSLCVWMSFHILFKNYHIINKWLYNE